MISFQQKHWQLYTPIHTVCRIFMLFYLVIKSHLVLSIYDRNKIIYNGEKESYYYLTPTTHLKFSTALEKYIGNN